MARPAEPPAVPEPPVRRGHVRGDEGEGAFGERDPSGLVESGPGAGERGDHEAVPVRQHLVVAQRPLAPFAHGQQRGAGLRQRRVVGHIHRVQPVEDVAAFPVAGRRHLIDVAEARGRRCAQDRLDLGPVPHIEAAFLALAVGVERRCEAGRAVIGGGRRHLPLQPADRLAHPLLEERRAGLLPYQRQQLDELGVVVEHLLEMRRQPALVGGIAREAAAEMVVDAALAHMRERVQDLVAEHAAAAPHPPEMGEDAGLRELGRAVYAAEERVHGAGEPHGDARIGLRVDAGPRCGLRQSLGRFPEPPDILGHRVRLRPPGLRERAQQLREAGPPPARLGREVGAAPERFAVGIEEHGERPAALFVHALERVLIDGVHVRAFLAVHLHIDEQLVHQPGDGLVLEALMRHDMAPVAGGVADG